MADDFFGTRDINNEFYNSYNPDTGKAGFGLVSTALQFLAVQNHPCSVETISNMLKISNKDVTDIVDDHPWMYLEGNKNDHSKLFIEHDGE